MGILDTAKDVITLVQKADNLELVKQVLALQADIMKMMEENRTLKDEIRELKGQLHTKASLTFREIHTGYEKRMEQKAARSVRLGTMVNRN